MGALSCTLTEQATFFCTLTLACICLGCDLCVQTFSRHHYENEFRRHFCGDWRNRHHTKPAFDLSFDGVARLNLVEDNDSNPRHDGIRPYDNRCGAQQTQKPSELVEQALLPPTNQTTPKIKQVNSLCPRQAVGIASDIRVVILVEETAPLSLLHASHTRWLRHEIFSASNKICQNKLKY